ncbi:MAG: RlmE family RNA methyltransferase [Spirochaetaceae bacterium]|nr:RlmE family RNA methyltransferase [Spirochaetaceae bacterium]
MSNYAKPDYWTVKALKEGYPARSVYKLREIAEKYALFSRGTSAPLRVLDLGAAPGSWSLYLLRAFKGRIDLAACDLSPLSAAYGKDLFAGGNFTFIQGDFTGDPARAAILAKAPFDVMVSDAAPATTGNRLVDTARSEELASTALRYAETALREGGSLVVKLFQGGATAEFLKEAKPLFAKCHTFKPKACRPESFETYFIGLKRQPAG